ncbi:hypothetical protein HPP92_007973 [Vanilla planifolia]|uniref:Uncharacterized protein n=1 Tax=Vanilla planifolia TaxID=51239 RepID=A0A835RNM8_VANPL|nr:hypothetical protein HPP92_008093 [Vanilla planifolia]KAG0491110.1 hypothetical protein HPP92_007973 [Vanilla planifolia]
MHGKAEMEGSRRRLNTTSSVLRTPSGPWSDASEGRLHPVHDYMQDQRICPLGRRQQRDETHGRIWKLKVFARVRCFLSGRSFT